MAEPVPATEALYTSPFFEVLRRADRIVQVARTDRAFASVEELDRAHTEVVNILDALPRAELSILVDLRLAPGRNEADVEAAMAPHRLRLFEGFARRAVLVRSAVGRLQVRRHAMKDGHDDLRVFTEAPAALEYLKA